MPVGIKDLVYTKGIKSTSGSIIYKDFVPTEDDLVGERLRAAGAIIIGKMKPWPSIVPIATNSNGRLPRNSLRARRSTVSRNVTTFRAT